MAEPMSFAEGWSHKDLWRRGGNGFCVEVSRHNVASISEGDRGTNRWCVYAYIYPDHPRFLRFSGDRLHQDASVELPLHGGASLLTYHTNSKGAITSVQVGADYNHLGDSHFTRCETVSEAMSVFMDAHDLFQFLQSEALSDD